MSARIRVGLVTSLLAAACGPKTSSSQDTGDDTTVGDDDTGTTGTPDATGTETGDSEPICTPRDGAGLDWQLTGSDPALPDEGGTVHVAVDDSGRILFAAADATDTDRDVLIGQLDTSGASPWSLRYEGPAGLRDEVLGVAVDPDGRGYVAILEQTRELVSEGYGNQAEFVIVVLAFGPDGSKRWRYVRELPPPVYNDNARHGDITLSSEGDVVVADFAVQADAPPHLLRLDRFGNEVLRTELGLASDPVDSVRIAVTPTNHTWVGTTSNGTTRVARIDPTGATVWEEGDSTYAFLTDVAAGDDEHAYVLRRIGDEEAGNGGFRLSRYTPDGGLVWEADTGFETGGGYPAGVVLDCDGAPIVAVEVSDPSQRLGAVFGFSTAGAATWSADLDAVNIAPRTLARGADGTLVVGGLQGSATPLRPWIAAIP